MSEFIQFHLIPSDKIERGKQVLLKEFKHRYVAEYEGNSDLADALMIWALTATANQREITPILLVNDQDWLNGEYGLLLEHPDS